MSQTAPKRGHLIRTIHDLGINALYLHPLALANTVEHSIEVPKTHSAAAAEIGRRVREARQSLGISLEDLGELSEIGWTSIGRIERGVSSPNAETLVRLATALEIDPGQFLSGITASDYGIRAHQITVRDLIKARREQSGS